MNRFYKSAEQVDYEKFMSQCTFSPRLTNFETNSPSSRKGEKPLYIVGIELENGVTHMVNIY